MNNFDAAPLLVALAIIIPVFVVISAIPAVLAFICLKRVPEAHRKQSPALCFLLMIPLFSLVWAFFVHPRVAASLKSYHDSVGNTSHGDCGAKLALWLCILPLLGIIPIVGMVAGVATLVIFIMFYVKAFDISSKIPRS